MIDIVCSGEMVIYIFDGTRINLVHCQKYSTIAIFFTLMPSLGVFFSGRGFVQYLKGKKSKKEAQKIKGNKGRKRIKIVRKKKIRRNLK